MGGIAAAGAAANAQAPSRPGPGGHRRGALVTHSFVTARATSAAARSHGDLHRPGRPQDPSGHAGHVTPDEPGQGRYTVGI
jgi:hypothetical protein